VNNLLVGGESAGGYHSVQTALLGWTNLPIKVLFLQYPALDVEDDFEPSKLLSRDGFDPNLYPYSLITEHLASLEPGEICTRAKFGSRMHLMTALVLTNSFCDISGDRAWINPTTSLETAGKLPPILLYHSKEDEAVSTLLPPTNE
jgi:acetyl esterase/lipase